MVIPIRVFLLTIESFVFAINKFAPSVNNTRGGATLPTCSEVLSIALFKKLPFNLSASLKGSMNTITTAKIDEINGGLNAF